MAQGGAQHLAGRCSIPLQTQNVWAPFFEAQSSVRRRLTPCPPGVLERKTRKVDNMLLRAAVQCSGALARRGAPPAVSRLAMGSRFNQQSSGQSVMFDEHDAERRRLLYRSKQRGVCSLLVARSLRRLHGPPPRIVSGWLEMDIMLGKWVRLRSPACMATEGPCHPHAFHFPGGGQPSRHEQAAPAAVRSGA